MADWRCTCMQDWKRYEPTCSDFAECQRRAAEANTERRLQKLERIGLGDAAEFVRTINE